MVGNVDLYLITGEKFLFCFITGEKLSCEKQIFVFVKVLIGKVELLKNRKYLLVNIKL